MFHDPSYLVSVVQVIAESSRVRSSASIHNLLDAYATFVNRLRSQSQILEPCDTLLPALVPLSAHKDGLLRALRRDVSIAHVDPFSRPHSSLDGIAVRPNIDAKQYARDSSLLCHHALCAVATIFRFPAFHLAFTEHDLSLLFSDVLDIALANQLPVLSEAKTYSLSLWALGCHRLPLSILEPRRDDLFSALQQSLDDTRRSANVLDGLKAISQTVEHHPPAFLDFLSPLLPSVITKLNHESVEHRLQASVTLGQFANALIHQTELPLTKWQSLSDHVISFLEPCCGESSIALGVTGFLRTVRTAFSAESHAHHTDGPARILALLASFIVLCGPTLYRKPTTLRTILQSLAMALTHKRSIVRALHPHVWRCFVWTFSRMLPNSENVEPTLISSAFHVIKQEVSGGIGVALASVLLSERTSATQRGDRISLAFSVIKAMVRAECKHTRREGFTFLQALTNDARARCQILQNTYEIPASVLVNGAIIRAEWDNLPSIIRSVPQVPLSVYWLEDTEIARHYKALIVIWKHASKTVRKRLDSGCIDIWLSILQACSRQLEREQHIPETTEMLRYTAAIIVEFLPSGDSQPNWDVHDQLCCLTCMDQLWFAVRRAFMASSLLEVAELILTSVLKYAFHVLDLGVGTLWGKLCADLMTTAPPSFLRDIHDPAASRLVIRSQRQLWGVVATSLTSSEPGLDWKELIKFLAIPICAWALSELELEAWKALFRNAIALSGDPTEVIGHFVSQYFQGKDVETWSPALTLLGFLLLCAREHGDPPSDSLLSVIDVCLTFCYSRAHRLSEGVTHSLELLSVIRDVIASAPHNVMYILRALRGSLCLWIEDHTEVMSDDEFNSVAVSLYCEVLKALENFPLSIQSLQDTEDFLASAFARIPSPAIAPFAFERFWRATYHGRSQSCGNLPPKIKFCLTCFVAAYGGDLADGLSLTSESQSQSIRNDSQDHFPDNCHYRDTGELDEPSFSADAWGDTEGAPHERQRTCVGRDTTFLVPSSDDDIPQPTILRQLQEYSSRIYASSQDGSERSMSPGMPLSPNGAVSRSRSHSPEDIHSITSSVPNQKRKFVYDGDVPQKRSRTSRSTLRTVRKLESEPATRDVTPVTVPRMNSVPLKKRKVFDGVEVPTFRQISRRRTAQRAVTSKSVVTSPHSTRSRALQSVLPSSDDEIELEDFGIDRTSSEGDIDRSLADAYPSSPPQSHSHGTLGRVTSLPFSSRLSEFDGLLPGLPQRGSPSAPPSLRKVKATVSRLDALRDVYSSVENGASQIPFDELLQATELVHKIGAVLTKQVGKQVNKKIDKKMDDPR